MAAERGAAPFPAAYESLLDQYVADVAAASGSTDNVYSVDTEYYQTVVGLKTYITYKITAGTPVVDTDAYPANGCKPAPGFTACITDAQLRNELRAVTSSHKLPTDLAHFYPVFLPPGVETEDIDGTNSASALLRLPPGLRVGLRPDRLRRPALLQRRVRHRPGPQREPPRRR